MLKACVGLLLPTNAGNRSASPRLTCDDSTTTLFDRSERVFETHLDGTTIDGSRCATAIIGLGVANLVEQIVGTQGQLQTLRELIIRKRIYHCVGWQSHADRASGAIVF